MVQIKNVSDNELEDNQTVKEVSMAQTQLKRKIELDDIHILKRIKMEDNEISKEFEINNNCTEVQTSSYQSCSLIYLPDLVLEKILECLSFHEVAKARMVCRSFNDICTRHLNRGFRVIQSDFKKLLEQSQQEYQRKIESNTIRIADIALDFFLLKTDVVMFLLNLTFLKYIKSNCFCFFPGKVIDDIARSLCQIKKFKQLKKNNESNPMALKNEFEIIKNPSMMAIRYFLSEILPMSRFTIPPPRIFSSKTSFKPSILKSFIGSLSYEDICHIKMLYKYFVLRETEIYLNSLKEEFKTVCFKEYDRLHLLERDIEGDQILGQVSLYNQSFYLVKWKDLNEADFFTYKECSSKFPNLWKKFVEKRENMALFDAKIIKHRIDDIYD